MFFAVHLTARECEEHGTDRLFDVKVNGNSSRKMATWRSSRKVYATANAVSSNKHVTEHLVRFDKNTHVTKDQNQPPQIKRALFGREKREHGTHPQSLK